MYYFPIFLANFAPGTMRIARIDPCPLFLCECEAIISMSEIILVFPDPRVTSFSPRAPRAPFFVFPPEQGTELLKNR